MHDLLDLGGRSALWRNFDANRITQQTGGQCGNFLRHRCGEQSGLAVTMGALSDALHIIDEAHIEHAVGFIEHQPAGLGEIDAVVANEVSQTARRRDQDVDACLHFVDLRHARDTAQHESRGNVRALGKLADRLFDLHCKLTGRRKD